MVQLLGVFAEFERATIIDRVIAGMERKPARGGWNGGSVPWGYRYNSVTGFLDVNPGESPLVPVIFDLSLNRRLAANNVAAPHGHDDVRPAREIVRQEPRRPGAQVEAHHIQ